MSAECGQIRGHGTESDSFDLVGLDSENDYDRDPPSPP